MHKSSIRVLVVDDFEPWRRFYCSKFQQLPEFQVIGDASDGLEAVRQAQQLQPDLILLDIGLPKLNGIEVARQIREIGVASKILFVSENRSIDIVKEALSTGAGGYLLKSDAALELLPAVETVLNGKRFVSTSLAGQVLVRPVDPQTGAGLHRGKVESIFPSRNVGSSGLHEAGFYSDDRHFLDHVTRFVAAALKFGNAAIVVATGSHRENLLLNLQAEGLDMGAAIEQGRYLPLDAANTLSRLMVNGMPDPVRLLELFGHLITQATKAAKWHPGVALFGECVHLLCAQGNPEAAMEVERLANELRKTHDVNMLCGYLPSGVPGGMDPKILQRICAEHSAVHTL